MNHIIESTSYDPARNLALEEMLYAGYCGGVVLYLWQNRSTVVIGRNQNAWKECRVSLLTGEGGKLARRSTGGGAVFHDLGNLNFSFVAGRRDYDVARQLSVVTHALAALGLDAEVSGRNDLLLRETGEKFSGNAFRLSESRCLHHGTLLISADMDKLSRYLAPSKEKLMAKGVESVRARVTNLSAHAPVGVADVKSALCAAFTSLYGDAETLEESALDKVRLDAETARYASWDWIYGKTPAFDAVLEHRFSWGEAQLLLRFRHGCVESARLFTDAMDENLPAGIEKALIGAPWSAADMGKRLADLPAPEARDIAAWLSGSALNPPL